MVYSTAPNEAEGQRIGRHVIGKRLAACVNIFPIKSIYWWKGKIEEDEEHVLIFKTRSKLVSQVIQEIENECTYDLPCAVSYEMSGGNEKYLKWIEESTLIRP